MEKGISNILVKIEFEAAMHRYTLHFHKQFERFRANSFVKVSQFSLARSRDNRHESSLAQ